MFIKIIFKYVLLLKINKITYILIIPVMYYVVFINKL